MFFPFSLKENQGHIIKMAASIGTEKMNQLIKKRQEIEAEIKELNDVLNSVSILFRSHTF